MSGKAQAKQEPQPRPTVGGSYTLNTATGEWEPTPAEPDTTPVTAPTDGID